MAISVAQKFMVWALHQSQLSHYVWTSLLANQLALDSVDCLEQEGAVLPLHYYFFVNKFVIQNQESLKTVGRSQKDMFNF